MDVPFACSACEREILLPLTMLSRMFPIRQLGVRARK